MTTDTWRVGVWSTDAHSPCDSGVFGWASHGFCTDALFCGAGEDAFGIWSREPNGVTFCGKYCDVLAQVRDLSFTPSLVLIAFAHAAGVAGFLVDMSSFSNMRGVPIAGGGAAMAPRSDTGRMRPCGEDVTLLAISGGRYAVESLNVLDASVDMLEFRGGGNCIEQLRPAGKPDWTAAGELWESFKSARRIAPDDNESIALTRPDGVNLHCHAEGDSLLAGADLPADGWLEFRCVHPDELHRRVSEFISVEGSLICGCAGLARHVKDSARTGAGSLCSFMFGEICKTEAGVVFGNLMMTRVLPVLGESD